MAKKKGRRGAAEADCDDDGSLCSSSTAACSMGEAAEQYGDPAAAAFSEAIDNTYESRATTREKAWEALAALLRNNVRSDDCYQSAQTLADRCLSAIRKGGPTEAASAATTLALHLITLGEPNDSLFQELLPELLRITRHGKGVPLKVAAVDSLALCCFVACEEEAATLRVMEHMQGLWSKDGAKLRAAALRGWAFLYTSLNSPMSSRQLEGTMSRLAALLHDPELEVRTAAGEGLALLYHTSGLASAEGPYYEDEEEEDEGWDEEEEEEEEDSLTAAAVNGGGWQRPASLQQQQEQQQQQAAAIAAGVRGLDLQQQQQPSPVQQQQQLSPVQQQQQSPATPPRPAVSDGSSTPAGLQQQASQTLPSPPLSPDAAAADTVAAVAAAAAAAVAAASEQQPRRNGDACSSVSCSSVSGLDLVVDRMKDLASNRGDTQRRSKRERAALRGCFRELRRVMEDGRVPEQKVKLRHGDTLLIDTMEGNCMMNFLKRFLAGGFQVHLQGNPFLHAVFGFTPMATRPERLSAQEKRAFRSPCSANSKARSQARRSQRAYKDGPGGGDW